MKKNLIALISVTSSLFILSGCKTTVQVNNGEVPSAYLAHAKKAAGIYHGQFNKVSGDLVINFSGNRPVVNFKSKNSTDILNSDCKSKIGLLHAVDVNGEGENLRITSAIFDFDPGQCGDTVDGRFLRLDFKEKNGTISLRAWIIAEAANPELCPSWEDSSSGYGGFTLTYRRGHGFSHTYLPRGDCRSAKMDQYLNGSFIR